jgi:hypothetical protein
MSAEVPSIARELAARLAVLFGADCQFAERLNDAQHRLLDANDRLWSGLHPDALGLVCDDRCGVRCGESAIAGRVIAVLSSAGGQRETESALLGELQHAHWAIHRAFCDYQSAYEERRRLAVDVGELSQELTQALTAVGWSVEAARNADVHELAAGGAR